MTSHRIDRVAVGHHGGKTGPCLEHGPKNQLTKEQQKRRDKQRQGDLPL